NVVQELQRRQAAIEDMRISDAAIFEHSEKTADEQGLAGANVPRQRQESFPPLNTMVKRKQRLLMSSGEIQKRGIGNNLEGIKPQFVKFFVHDFVYDSVVCLPGGLNLLVYCPNLVVGGCGRSGGPRSQKIHWCRSGVAGSSRRVLAPLPPGSLALPVNDNCGTWGRSARRKRQSQVRERRSETVFSPRRQTNPPGHLESGIPDSRLGCD